MICAAETSWSVAEYLALRLLRRLTTIAARRR